MSKESKMIRKIIFSVTGFLAGVAIGLLIFAVGITFSSVWFFGLLLMLGSLGGYLGYKASDKINKFFQRESSAHYEITGIRWYFMAVGVLYLSGALLDFVYALKLGIIFVIMPAIAFFFGLIFIYIAAKFKIFLLNSSQLVNVLYMRVGYSVLFALYAWFLIPRLFTGALIGLIADVMFLVYFIKRIKVLPKAAFLISVLPRKPVNAVAGLGKMLFLYGASIIIQATLTTFYARNQAGGFGFFEVFLFGLPIILLISVPFIITLVLGYRNEEKTLLRAIGVGFLVWTFIALIPFTFILALGEKLNIWFILVEVLAGSYLVRYYNLTKYFLFLVILFPVLGNLYILISGMSKLNRVASRTL